MINTCKHSPVYTTLPSMHHIKSKRLVFELTFAFGHGWPPLALEADDVLLAADFVSLLARDAARGAVVVSARHVEYLSASHGQHVRAAHGCSVYKYKSIVLVETE